MGGIGLVCEKFGGGGSRGVREGVIVYGWDWVGL